MTAKLIKIEDGYELFTQGFLKGSTNHGLIESLNIEEGPIRYKLSPKNCQAIELGYDLDELAKEECEYNQDSLRQYDSKFISFYKEGFQKALELMGDKKFSEEDMSKAWSEGYHRRVDELNGKGLRYFDKFIQLLQQTEWEVEIEMENYEPLYGMGSTPRPKLDADGCLILKRI